MTILTHLEAGTTRSPRRTPAARRPEAAASLVDTIRQVIRQLVSASEQGRELALALVEQHWERLDASCPLSEDPRPWQVLASDLAAALTGKDDARAERALHLSEQIRSTVTMMARNPLEELAVRPASRRVLVALHELGGRAEATQVRDRSGHSGPHLSNILKALQGHGLVASEPLKEDRRRKVLTLTRRGESEIVRHVAQFGKDVSFRSGIRVARAAAAAEDYPQELRALETAL